MTELEAALWVFHVDNPRVYELLRQYALQVKACGFETYSIDAIFHRVRWHVFIETSSHDDFKLNDHHTAYYSRLLMQQEPELADFFRTRALRNFQEMEAV